MLFVEWALQKHLIGIEEFFFFFLLLEDTKKHITTWKRKLLLKKKSDKFNLLKPKHYLN